MKGLSDKKGAVIAALIGAIALVITSVITGYFNMQNSKGEGNTERVIVNVSQPNEFSSSEEVTVNVSQSNEFSSSNENELIYPTAYSNGTNQPVQEESNLEFVIVSITDTFGGPIAGATLYIESINWSLLADIKGVIKLPISELENRYGEFGAVEAVVRHEDYTSKALNLGYSQSQKIVLTNSENE